MEHKAFMKPPKKEEEDEGQVPDNTMKTHSTEDEAVMDELEGILCIEDDMNWEDEFSTTQFFEDADIWDCNGDMAIKSESSCGYWDFDDKKASLKLSLNYQEVLEAWSNRGPSNIYMGEVPVMEEEQGICSRRQASVMRYKEKRQSRLFSKKIRYEVRKVNADKRPRIKGRFVKRFGDKMQQGS